MIISNFHSTNLNVVLCPSLSTSDRVNQVNEDTFKVHRRHILDYGASWKGFEEYIHRRWNQNPFLNIMFIAWEITEKPLNLTNSQSMSLILSNGLWFLILLLKTVSGSTMKPYLCCKWILNPISGVGEFQRPYIVTIFALQKKFCIAYFLP